MRSFFLCLTALASFAFFACSGAPQPDIKFVDLKGLESILAEHKGEGVLLNFWAIWCEPCVEELPHLIELAREFKGQGASVLTISYDLMVPEVTRDTVLSRMRDFVVSRKLDLPVLIYDSEDYDAINERFGLPGPIPYTLAIGRNGTVVDSQEGQAGKDRFAEMMRKAIGR